MSGGGALTQVWAEVPRGTGYTLSFLWKGCFMAELKASLSLTGLATQPLGVQLSLFPEAVGCTNIAHSRPSA